MHMSSVDRFENARVDPRLISVLRLCDGLEVPLEVFLNDIFWYVMSPLPSRGVPMVRTGEVLTVEDTLTFVHGLRHSLSVVWTEIKRLECFTGAAENDKNTLHAVATATHRRPGRTGGQRICAQIAQETSIFFAGSICADPGTTSQDAREYRPGMRAVGHQVGGFTHDDAHRRKAPHSPGALAAAFFELGLQCVQGGVDAGKIIAGAKHLTAGP